MWNLDFISKEDYENHVTKTIEKYIKVINDISFKEFNKNIVDPIKFTFDIFLSGINDHELIKFEINRQIDKKISNLIGYFHQNLFKYINNCIVPKKGWDIKFTKNKKSIIFIEMKNKFNTMNASSKSALLRKMKAKILENKYNKCYLVEIVSWKSGKTNWGKNKRIARITIDRLLFEITGHKNAFENICNNLPNAIKNIMKSMNIKKSRNKKQKVNEIISKLKERNGDFSSSLFKLAFENYLGYRGTKN